jgi:hypothetical protein
MNTPDDLLSVGGTAADADPSGVDLSSQRSINLDASREDEEDEAFLPDPGSQQLDDVEPPQDAQRVDEELLQSGLDFEELCDLAETDDIKLALSFITLLQNASLEDDGMRLDPDVYDRLLHPPQEELDLDDPDLRLALDLFLAVGNSSQETYTSVRKAIRRRYPEEDVLTYDQIKRRVAQLSGVVPLVHDMCVKTCVAYVGPFRDLDTCPYCGELRYDPIKLAASDGKTKVARREFHTMPIGPQLQALWRNKDSAQRMRYRDIRTEEILKELGQNDGNIPSYYDFFHGSEYLQAVEDGRIKEGDPVLMFSIDGAQLYQNKASDCWIYIWVVFNHDPASGRYIKKNILVGAIIPGPNKPKILESFLFPGLHHLAAIQKQGLPIWDASRKQLFTSHPFLALATADGPAMASINGLVGHQGRNGCRLYCPLKGRRKPGGSQYYPALLKPINYEVDGCSHADIDPFTIGSRTFENYETNLKYLIESPNDTQYKKRRLETGIVKPGIFLGLPNRHILTIPRCFGYDIMHLVSLNIPDLLISLWRGTIDCDKDDDRCTWSWAVLRGNIWTTHGQAVASITPYLPGSFDRPPRNPAEKINSGYKAWEFLMYIFGLGPGLFYNILPRPFWRNFCKLVFGVRILHQYEICADSLRDAYATILDFVVEFELIYCERRASRIHFVRPCIHTIIHAAPEVARAGPGMIASQWTMERVIGDLGSEIRQPSNPFANLSQRAVRRCQVNALKAMIPDLEEPTNVLPRGAQDLGGGYVLLKARQKNATRMREHEAVALRAYCLEQDHDLSDSCDLRVLRWARLRVPTGQVARSLWKESLKAINQVRMARNVKVMLTIYCLFVN